MHKKQGIAELERTRIISIVRGIAGDDLYKLAELLLEADIPVMEVTLNSPDALAGISELQRRFGGQMYIGAGTVLDIGDAERAMEAGASFLVTPNTDEDVIQLAASRDIPIYPGAMTPTEIVRSWKAGAAAVKIFPSASIGLSYIKELQGPLSHIPMIAVGGVTAANIAEFLAAGCYAVGVGGYLADKQALAAGDTAAILQKAKELRAQADRWKQL
ncbi:bifunctional 4-hydroxy-2-oxoglutarate aldolase/2-dehydro-3-deoxy-phosphogluconate aldolase [Xylanibacillus composti]|uniref:2-keto-3-deoxy-phosphogluconate aldolase n=1 Tax=Xylanibacillus composti TaxID=1572762 RepID=A0A8J4H3U2_9BACL|nr:bifunctional 4-hydroxy-2-oxoglutarate aldolase/2-dehydro-3-deoxy-phosphogluconate aldolase [Xylanibacillus composti]MDT9724932.1 bifunctional 4-hydroxy-2-oxoglutarate aldolase/2-dehydro-3-deoxy-phosphogluconate aldolase [Xylanibacillus composti]GIQ68168.1 2-keto-3-deoxy-phosphogluconate aldolase [Xylanibacillus composti]